MPRYVKQSMGLAAECDTVEAQSTAQTGLTFAQTRLWVQSSETAFWCVSMLHRPRNSSIAYYAMYHRSAHASDAALSQLQKINAACATAFDAD